MARRRKRPTRKRPTTNAVLQAARQLGLDDEALAKVMRCSMDTVRRYREGEELARVTFHLQTSWLLLDTARMIRTRAAPRQKSVDWLRIYDEKLGRCPGDLLVEEWGLDRLHAHLAGPKPEPVPKPGTKRPAPQASPPPPPPPRPKIKVEPAKNTWEWIAGGAAVIGATVLGAVLWVARNKR